MDSKAILDYALFQLTPTRTRCDLVVFSGGFHEKIASGLFEPFISNLKFAKDEISKGGYSIKLHPPTNFAPWFTKATFERFVRFVSTPAVLERFVSIEREILQIESSVEANDLSKSNATVDEGLNINARRSADSTKIKDDLKASNDVQEENSKIRLQRLMESRIALLRKDQAMAYACGLVAGFEVDSIDDLIYFGDAFGASRLREACIKFKELCKKKHADALWMKELATVEPCFASSLSFSGTSGIILANEIPSPNQNGSVSDGNVVPSESTTNPASLNSKKDDNLPASDQMLPNTANSQVPMPWANNIPSPYMHNLQNPIQHMPSYGGYPFTSMQSAPPYHLQNMQWPSNMDKFNPNLVRDSNYRTNKKTSARRKEKYPSKKGSEDSEEDRHTDSNDIDSGSGSSSDKEQERRHSLKNDAKRKNHRKKSSGTVVIRNINYITPNRRDGNEGRGSDESPDNDAVDEDSIKEKVEIAVGSLEKFRRVDKNNTKRRRATQGQCILNESSDAADQDPDENQDVDASKGGNTNENWNSFKNLLMIDERMDTNEAGKLQPIDVQDEHFTIRSSEGRISLSASPALELDSQQVPKQLKAPDDSFIMSEKDGGSEGRVKSNDIDNGEGSCPVMRRRDCLDGEMFSNRVEEAGNYHVDAFSSCVSESSINKSRNDEDWFIVDHAGKSVNSDATVEHKLFNDDFILSSGGDYSHAKKRSKEILLDDSFMIQPQLAVADSCDLQWKTDISMVENLNSDAQRETSNITVSPDKHELSNNGEPNDLCMVLERDSGLEPAAVSWTMDYEVDISFSETDRRCSGVEMSDMENKLPMDCKKTNTSDKKVSGMRNPEKAEMSRVSHGFSGKNKSDIIYKNKKPSSISRSVVQKSKLEKEEEVRKKMEELMIQRQKRIAERTASSGLARAASKKDQFESRTAKGSTRNDKNRTQSIREINRISSVKVRAS